jgi:hypothetical protein
MNPIKFLRISQIVWLIAGLFSLFCVIWIQIKQPSTTAWFFLLSFVVSMFMYFWRGYQIKKLKSKNGK